MTKIPLSELLALEKMPKRKKPTHAFLVILLFFLIAAIITFFRS